VDCLLESILKIEGDKQYLEALYEALQHQKNSKRLTYDLDLKRGTLTVFITASDSTALRAGLNTYLRIIQQAENVKKVIE